MFFLSFSYISSHHLPCFPPDGHHLEVVLPLPQVFSCSSAVPSLLLCGGSDGLAALNVNSGALRLSTKTGGKTGILNETFIHIDDDSGDDSE
jgi:hypothetical protein